MVRLDFAGGSFKEPANLHEDVMLQLESIEDEMGIPARRVSAPGRLRRLLQMLHRQTGQPVAVLVDEYDKPILDALEVPEVACANRDYLRGLYGMIKSSDAHVRFTFVTGVSKFTKVSIFSDLNNLTDITLDRRYSAICGYTEADLDAVFAPELGGLDREQVREWYNGYRWRGPEKVYNPYDVLLLLDSREFKAHWFETGTPAFLLDTLFERRLSSVSLSEMLGTEDLLSAFDVNKIGTEALLFQTGYLTIIAEERLGGAALYRLGYPNREVRESLNRVLLRHLVQDTAQQTANSIRLARLLEAHDCGGLKTLFHAFFASIPYHNGTPTTTSPITRASPPACSTPTSPPSATTSRWRSRAATDAWTWPCAPPATSTCSSSRWPRWRRPVRPSPSCRSAATPTSTAPPASRSTSSASSSAAPPATSPPSR